MDKYNEYLIQYTRYRPKGQKTKNQREREHLAPHQNRNSRSSSKKPVAGQHQNTPSTLRYSVYKL
jgi:hypothetical protein